MPTITNEQFLQAIFGRAWEEAHCVAFPGDPADPNNRPNWAGNRYKFWSPQGRDRARGQNTYFVVSLFRDDPKTGGAHRKRELFERCHCIVLDDIGTKASRSLALERMGPPDWRLETSPNNEQWGYRLAPPETDPDRVDALIDGILAGGLTAGGKDPGMRGVNRLVRLPEGVNGKAHLGPGGHRHRLLWWNPSPPSRSLDDIAKGWGVTLPGVGAGPRRRAGPRASVVQGKDDPILEFLFAQGMVQGEVAGKGWDIDCPWMADHTQRASTGTMYFADGAFRCQHGHCDKKGRKDLVAWCEERALEESAGLVNLWGFQVMTSSEEAEVDAAAETRWGATAPSGSAPSYATAGAGGVGALGAPGAPSAPSAPSGNPGQVGTRGRVKLGPLGDEAQRFFDELVFLQSDDRFVDLRSGLLLTRSAIDVAWTGRLARAGALPGTNKRGDPMAASRWFWDLDNVTRAKIVDRLTYAPGEPRLFEEAGESFVNKWLPGPRLGLPVGDRDVQPWLDLVGLLTNRDGPEAREALLDWFALVVGEPGTKPGWHVILQGPQGLGKDLMLQPVILGVGETNVGRAKGSDLHGTFNTWTERRMGIINELRMTTKGSATASDQYNALKEWTENASKYIKINAKYQQEYYARNCAAIVITSNDPAAVALEWDDRRFLVIMAGDRTDTPPWPAQRYRALVEWMKDAGGAELVVEWLWQRWETMDAGRRAALMGRAPETAGRALMIAHVEDPVTAYMREKIEGNVWPDLMTSEDVARDLAATAKAGTAGFSYVPSPNKWGATLARLGGAKVYNGNQVRLKSGQKTRMWATRAVRRFAGMGEAQLSQAYASAAAVAFKDFGDDADKVVKFTDKKSDASDASRSPRLEPEK